MEDRERRSYKSFTEVKATLTPAEERFERYRNTIGLFLGPLVALIIYWIPMPGLSPKAHTLAAIIGWIVTWWVTEPIPIPMSALIGAVLCVVFDVADDQCRRRCIPSGMVLCRPRSMQVVYGITAWRPACRPSAMQA